MKITAAAASAALFLAPVVLATPAQADPGCQQVTGRLSVCPGSQLVQVQNPDDPNGASIWMTQADAEQIADAPNGYPNVWTLKPKQSLMDRINQGAAQVNSVLCMGIPSALKPPTCTGVGCAVSCP
jgi:hypothetical protein